MKSIITKRQKVWNLIKKNGSITSWDAIRLFNYTRLPDAIHVWKRRGIQIKKVREEDEETHWTRYYISPEEMARAEQNGLIRI